MTNKISATGKRRLLKLAEFLETGDMGKGKFQMSTWAELDGQRKLGDCGTAACALGWATTIPSFKRAGLHLRGERVFFGDERADHYNEVCFFDLGPHTSCQLFWPADIEHLNGPRGRRIVAKRIREIVEEGFR